MAVLSKAFSLAEVWGIRPDNSNPCRRVERFKETSRRRFLLAKEFSVLGAVLVRAKTESLSIIGRDGVAKNVRANPEAVRAIHFMIFTGMGGGEVKAFDGNILTLKKARPTCPIQKQERR